MTLQEETMTMIQIKEKDGTPIRATRGNGAFTQFQSPAANLQPYPNSSLVSPILALTMHVTSQSPSLHVLDQ